MNRRFVSIAMVFVFTLVVAGGLYAGGIKRITKASQFRHRQSPRLKLKPIVIKPLDLSGGQNIESAKTAVKEAIAKVKKEIADQTRLLKSYKQRLTKTKKRIAQLRVQRAKIYSQREQIREELNILRQIQNPSQAILDCIAELEQDEAKATSQISNIEKAIKTYQDRAAFIEKIGKSAKTNLGKLKTALGHLQNALNALGRINLPKPKPEWRKNLRLAPKIIKLPKVPKHNFPKYKVPKYKYHR